MAKTLNLEIVTPQRPVLKEDIKSLVVPGVEGYLGILPNHAPLITTLQTGLLKYRAGEEIKYLTVSGGFMEVSHNRVTILADTAERIEKLGQARAEAARERALSRLKEMPPPNTLPG